VLGYKVAAEAKVDPMHQFTIEPLRAEQRLAELGNCGL
jgi:hypothetical protein